MTKKQTLTILLAIAFTAQIAAQVTIGSSKAPSLGSLLDLKDAGTYLGNETASKGLGLPRVVLTNAAPKTAKELAESIGNVSGEEYGLDTHVGLVVYNSNPEGCMADRDVYPPLPGVYVWSGTEWQHVFESTDDVRTIVYGSESVSANGVSLGTFTLSYGSESETYNYADFGPAGVWMTQNLRTQYSPMGIPLTMSGNQSLDGKDAGGKPQKLAAYPREVNPTLSDYYSKNREDGAEVGLLYDWYTATDHHNCSNADQNQVSVLGGAVGNLEVENKEAAKYIKGICPAGWHLPSDREWTMLIKELTVEADKYATGSYSSLDKDWDTAWDTAIKDYMGIITGAVMKSPIRVYKASNITEGESRAASDGGFDAYLAGEATNGVCKNYSTGTSFWSSSSYSHPTDRLALSRSLNHSQKQFYKGMNDRRTFYSVRCKKN